MTEKERGRERSLEEWQNEWDYYLTQVITGHRYFKVYSERIESDDECVYYREKDTVEYTVLECVRWERMKTKMLKSSETYKVVHQFIKKLS